jgi:hypothetical protein
MLSKQTDWSPQSPTRIRNQIQPELGQLTNAHNDKQISGSTTSQVRTIGGHHGIHDHQRKTGQQLCSGGI